MCREGPGTGTANAGHAQPFVRIQLGIRCVRQATGTGVRPTLLGEPRSVSPAGPLGPDGLMLVGFKSAKLDSRRTLFGILAAALPI